jgi:hypothetical protein
MENISRYSAWNRQYIPDMEIIQGYTGALQIILPIWKIIVFQAWGVRKYSRYGNDKWG